MKTVKLLLFIIAITLVLLITQLVSAQTTFTAKSLHSLSKPQPVSPLKLGQERTENLNILDSTYFFSWDTNTTKWLNGAVGFVHVGMPYLATVSYDTVPGTGIGKAVYFYGVNNTITGDVYSFLDNNHVWQKSIQDNNTYDANNNWTIDVQKTWNGTSWDNYTKGIQTFNANNKVTNAVSQGWNGSAFENNLQDTYGYNLSNNDTSDLYQSWNGSSWDNISLSTYTYSANHNQITNLFQFWGTSSFYNVQLDKYTYNVANKMIVDTTFNWDTINLVWDTMYRNVIGYNAHNNDTNDLYQQWKGGAWASYAHVLHTYDANNNQMLGLSQVWDTINLVWVNSAEFVYTYDANNDLLTEVDQFKWNGSHWVNSSQSDSTRYYYGLPQSINNIKSSVDETIHVAPNPNNGQFTLSANLITKDNYVIEVQNVLGQTVYSENLEEFSGRYSKQIDMKMYGKGLYFVSLKTSASQVIKKVIIY